MRVILSIEPWHTRRAIGRGRVVAKVIDASEAAQLAHQLTEKYGADALTFARKRARRAIEVGDELALDAWRAVIAATEALLRKMADA